MSVIVPARALLDILVHHTYQYEHGEISALDLDRLIDRTRRQINRACWCDEGVCCTAHQKHTNPHMRCILR